MNRKNVEIPVIKHIGVGRVYIINSSYGYAGILEGVVEVVEICTPLENEDVSMSADSFIEAELSISIEDYRNGDIHDLDLTDDDIDNAHEWDTGLWVRFSYPKVPEEGIVNLPIALFADRTVTLH